MTQIKSGLYLSGCPFHQFVYVCDCWKFAQNIFTFMNLKSKLCKCNVKQRKNPLKISIYSSIYPPIVFAFNLADSFIVLLRDAYKLLSFVSMYVFERQCSKCCFSFGMWVDVRLFAHQIHSLLLIVLLKDFFPISFTIFLVMQTFNSNGNHCHDRKKCFSIHKYFSLNFVVNSENWWCKSKECKNSIDIKWSLERLRVRDRIIVALLMSCHVHFFSLSKNK